MRLKLFFVFFLSVFFGAVSIGWAQTVAVDAKYNCCDRDSYKYCAVKIDLSPGRYIFKPAGGALSRWGDDNTAYTQNQRPWEWQVYINDGTRERPWSLGEWITCETQAEAFERQKNKRVNITLNQSSTIYLWVQDVYNGKDYCSDNRGKLIVEIIKID